MKKMFCSTFVGLIILFFLSKSSIILADAHNLDNYKEINKDISLYLSSDNEKLMFQQRKAPFKEVWGYGEVFDIKYSPNHKWFAVGTSLGVEVYNTHTRKLEKHFITKDKVKSLDFSPDGSFLAIGLINGQLIVWNLNNFSFKVHRQNANIKSVKHSSDGKSIFVGLSNGIVKQLNYKGRTVKRFVYQRKINAITENADSILIMGNSKSVLAYGKRNRNVRTLTSHNSSVTSITANAKWFVSGGMDNTVKLYSFTTGETKSLYLHNSPSAKLIIVPKSNILFSADINGEIKQVNLSTQKVKTLFSTGKTIKNMAVSPDGKEISLVLSDNKLLFISLPSLSVKVMTNHLPNILSADYSKNVKLVITGHDDGSVSFWINENKEVIIKKEHDLWVNTVSIHVDNKLSFSGDGMGNIIMWDIKNFGPKKRFSLNQAIIGLIPVSRDKILVLTPVTLYSLRLSSGKFQSIKRFNKRIYSFSYNNRNKLLALSLSNGKVLIIDSKGKVIRKIKNTKPIVSMRWGLSKRQLILSFSNQRSTLISIDNTSSRQEIGQLYSNIFSFDDIKKASIIWSSKGVLMLVKMKNPLLRQSDKVKPLLTNSKADLIKELKEQLAKANLSQEDKAKLHLKIAQVYESEGEYEKSVLHYQKALSYYKELGNGDWIWRIYNNIAVIHIYKRKFKLAVKTFNDGLLLVKNHPILLFNLGVAYSRWKKLKLTYLYYNKALNSATKRRDLKTVSHVYYVMAKFYYRQKKWDKAKSYLSKSLELSNKLNPALVKKCLKLQVLIKKKK